MKSPQTGRGFTLIEILIVIVILLTLMALLMAALGPAIIKAKNLSTKAMLTDLEIQLEQYSAANSGYPIKPGGNGLDSSSSPDFYQTPCAPLGSKANGSEDNSALLTFLLRNTRFSPSIKNIVNDRLVDDFGSPVIVRFLVINMPNGKMVKVIAWSYGHDGTNDVNATPSFACATPPGDDATEWNNIQASLAQSPDDPHVP